MSLNHLHHHTTDVEYSFKIRLSEVAAKFNSAIPEGVLAAGSTPFFRCDFDGKVLQSENCNLPGDPVWQFRQSFEYRLLEPGIDALVASLAGRNVTFEVFVSDGSRQALIGRCAADLLSVATGASKFQLKLTPMFAPNSGEGTQRNSAFNAGGNAYLSCSLQMEQQSVVHLSLQQMTFASLPSPTATKLHYLLLEGGTAIETSVLAPTSTPYFETLPPVQCRTSMKALLSTSVRITLIDAMRGDAPIGTLDLPISELLLSADEIGTASSSFKKNLYSSREYFQNFTALITGSLLIERLPAFAQLASGQNVDGEISGKPLLPSCFLPPRYVKRPSRLPDYQHAPRALAINPSAASAGSAYAHARNNNNSNNSYIPAQVSSMPALSSPQRRMYEPTGIDPKRHADRAIAYESNALPGSGVGPFKSPHRPTALALANQINNNNNNNNSNVGLNSSINGYSTKKINNKNNENSVMMIPKSPVANATQELIGGQDEANYVLENQQRRLAETRAELTQRIAEETFASQQKLDDLANEENHIKEKLTSLGGHISHLHQQLEALEEGFDGGQNARGPGGIGATTLAQASPFFAAGGGVASVVLNRQAQEMEREMADLAVIAMDLEKLANNLRTHVLMDDSLKRNALELVEKSREQLFRDSQALAAVENNIVNSSISRSQSRNRGSGGGVSGRAISPINNNNNKHHRVGSAESVMSSPSRRNSTSGELAVLNATNQNAQPPNNHNTNNDRAATSPRRDGGYQDEIEEDRFTNNTNNKQSTSSSSSSAVDPAIQAANSAIVNNDVVGLKNVIRQHPRALHPRSLLLACTQRKPNPDLIDALLELRPQLMQMTDASTGRTALHCACAADIPNAEAIRVLLDNGASVSDYDAEGLTAFHVALLNAGDFGNIMRYALLDYGANPNQPCQGGCTPALLCAASDSHLEAMMFLKACGGDVVSEGPDQKRLPSHRVVPAPPLTPLEKAEKCGAVATRRFLGRVGTMA